MVYNQNNSSSVWSVLHPNETKWTSKRNFQLENKQKIKTPTELSTQSVQHTSVQPNITPDQSVPSELKTKNLKQINDPKLLERVNLSEDSVKFFTSKNHNNKESVYNLLNEDNIIYTKKKVKKTPPPPPQKKAQIKQSIVSPHKLGSIPTYLSKRMKEAQEVKEAEIAKKMELEHLDRLNCPKNCHLLPEKDRIDQLTILKQQMGDLRKQHFNLPMIVKSETQKRTKLILEEKMNILDELIEKFERPHVFVEN